MPRSAAWSVSDALPRNLAPGGPRRGVPGHGLVQEQIEQIEHRNRTHDVDKRGDASDGRVSSYAQITASLGLLREPRMRPAGLPRAFAGSVSRLLERLSGGLRPSGRGVRLRPSPVRGWISSRARPPSTVSMRRPCGRGHARAYLDTAVRLPEGDMGSRGVQNNPFRSISVIEFSMNAKRRDCDIRLRHTR